VAVESEFPKEIDVVDLNDRIIKIGVEYPWVPIKCKKCSFFGHATHTCSKTEKAVWVPRKQEQKKDFISKALVKERFDGGSQPGPSGVDKWTVVRCAKKTPKSHPVAVDNSIGLTPFIC